MKYRIAGAIVDFDSNRIERADRSIELEPRVANVLRYLILHAGEVVTREALLEEVWNTQNISDDAVTRCINLIRRCFDDNPREPRVLQTLTKRGYRLIAEVEALDGAPVAEQIAVVRMRPERHGFSIAAGAFLGGGAITASRLETFLSADMARLPDADGETQWRGGAYGASARIAGADLVVRVRRPLLAVLMPYAGGVLGFIISALLFLGTGTNVSHALAVSLLAALGGAVFGWLLLDRLERRAADDVTHRRDAILAAILRA